MITEPAQHNTSGRSSPVCVPTHLHTATLKPEPCGHDSESQGFSGGPSFLSVASISGQPDILRATYLVSHVKAHNPDPLTLLQSQSPRPHEQVLCFCTCVAPLRFQPLGPDHTFVSTARCVLLSEGQSWLPIEAFAEDSKERHMRRVGRRHTFRSQLPFRLCSHPEKCVHNSYSFIDEE